MLTNQACTPTDSLGNSWTLRVSQNSGGNIAQQIYTSTIANAGSDTFTASGGGGSDRFEIQIVQYTGITGIGTNGIDNSANNPASFSSTITITTSSASVVYEGWDVHNGGGTNACPALAPVTGATIFSFNCDISTTNGKNSLSAQSILTGGPGTFAFTVSWTGATTGNNNQVHMAIELDIAPAPGVSLASQCYGNCGSPAITLANTNSTHTTNFNQSITLFYEFQSNLNGFLLNVTTNLAKSYGSINGAGFGIYTIPSCPTGLTPFTIQCPGQLQQGTAPLILTTLPKGRDSFANLHIPVTNGQWIGIALSAVQSGLDVNDTNSNVALFQTTEGKIPTIIQQAQALGNSKMGLWAWITGNTNIGPQQPSTGTFNCAGFLDCLLPNWVNSFCALGTPSCLGMSGLVWAGILGVVFTFVVVKYGTEIMPGYRVPIGELFMFFFLMWLFVMSGLNLTFVWIPIFFFFVISLLMRKNVGDFL